MRAFSPVINVFLTCLAALAAVPVLGLPWFGPAIDSNDGFQGQLELMGEALARWFGSAGATTTGTAVLTWAESALVGVVGATALLALAMLIAPLRGQLRGLLKALPMAAPVVVLAGMIGESHRPDVEPRFGAFVALALTVFLVSAANQAADVRETKPAPKPYTPGPGRAY